MFGSFKTFVTKRARVRTLGPVLALAMTVPALQNAQADQDVDTHVIPQASSLAALTAKDRKEIAFVVHSHVWAMTNRKAELIYKLATPSHKSAFATAPDYLKHLRRKHRALVTARALTIDSLSESDGALIQHTYITDARKRTWRASFTLQHNHSDGGWQIDSFAMTLAPGQLI